MNKKHLRFTKTEIKATFKYCISVVITSVLNEESLATSLGADDYMKKPIDRTFFLNVVKRYITEKNQKVLIVDDDENTRDLLNKILNNEGYLSIDAKNGEDALEPAPYLPQCPTRKIYYLSTRLSVLQV